MILINGPYNGRNIADAGTVTVAMCIYSDGIRVGSVCGVATYEPSADRLLAFWLDNTWTGPIVAIFD